MLGLLNITEAMSIALHLCVAVTENGRTFSATREIAQRLGFSPHHAAKVVRQLVHAGVLETGRGPAGGARLSRDPSRISLYEIYVAAGGIPERNGCLLDRSICDGSGCALGIVLGRENARLVKLLRRTTLERVVQSLVRKRGGKQRSGARDASDASSSGRRKTKRRTT